MVIQAKNIRVEIGSIPKKREKNVIYFDNLGEMNKVLNENRIDLLNIIKGKNPDSLYELAQLVDRDQGNVNKDIKILEDNGFINIEKQKEGNRVKSFPECELDGINIVIKIGAGAFGLAKETLDEMREEFKGEKLTKNKEYTKKIARKTIAPLKKTVKRLARGFDIVTRN